MAVIKQLKSIATNVSEKSIVQSTKDSAQQIWLAGLGAFSKAQEEGGKVFEALVQEGMTLQRKTQSAAEEKLTEAASRMVDMANGITTRATGLSSMATGQWDKLEGIFEERVARVGRAAAIEGLGKGPGETELTRMRFGPQCAAMWRVSCTRPALAGP